MAVADLDYWVVKRGLPKEKITLGVPFYGYGFGSGVPDSMPYRDIIIKYPNAQISFVCKLFSKCAIFGLRKS